MRRSTVPMLVLRMLVLAIGVLVGLIVAQVLARVFRGLRAAGPVGRLRGRSARGPQARTAGFAEEDIVDVPFTEIRPMAEERTPRVAAEI